jgi:hypothetical protein
MFYPEIISVPLLNYDLFCIHVTSLLHIYHYYQVFTSLKEHRQNTNFVLSGDIASVLHSQRSKTYHTQPRISIHLKCGPLDFEECFSLFTQSRDSATLICQLPGHEANPGGV